MSVDGPSRALIGFSNYTQKIAADAVNPNKVASAQMNSASDTFRLRSDSASTESSHKNREAVSTGMARGRADTIEYSRQADAQNRSADKTRSSLEQESYSKGAIIDTMA